MDTHEVFLDYRHNAADASDVTFNLKDFKVSFSPSVVMQSNIRHFGSFLLSLTAGRQLEGYFSCSAICPHDEAVAEDLVGTLSGLCNYQEELSSA